MNKKLILKPIMLISLSLLINIHTPVNAAPLDRSNKSIFKKDSEYKRLIGITSGAGSIKNDKDEQGTSIYINMFLLWVNFSAEHQRYDTHSISNTYTGIGMGRYLQLQYGYGDEGYLLRARSEIETLGKITVFIAAERYREKPEYDNVSAGIGYNF